MNDLSWFIEGYNHQGDLVFPQKQVTLQVNSSTSLINEIIIYGADLKQDSIDQLKLYLKRGNQLFEVYEIKDLTLEQIGICPTMVVEKCRVTYKDIKYLPLRSDNKLKASVEETKRLEELYQDLSAKVENQQQLIENLQRDLQNVRRRAEWDGRIG